MRASPVMSRTAVTPLWTSRRSAASAARRPWPMARCWWTSIRPGIANRPSAATRSAPGGTAAAAGCTAAIRSPRVTMVSPRRISPLRTSSTEAPT